MNPTPAGWPRISSSVFYRDANAAIAWLCQAMGFTVRLKVDGPDGQVVHSELCYGDGLVMVASEAGEADEAGEEGKNGHGDSRAWKRLFRSPASLDGKGTQCLMLIVDDVDAHCAHARASGARVVEEPATHDYGAEYWTDRSYGALDPEGHLWWVTQRLRTGGA